MSIRYAPDEPRLSPFFRFPVTTADQPLRPKFPVQVMPGPARRLVEEGAKALDVAADLIAVPLLTFAASVIGNSQTLRLKDGFVVRPILYTAIVAPSGSGKTPAQDLAKAPLDVLQAEEWDKYQQAKAAYRQDEQRGPAPVLRHLYTTDATMEALAPMAEVSPGVVVYHDELLGLFRSFDAYRKGKGNDRQRWLSNWSGGTLKIDRKGAPPILVRNPVICVMGGIQPVMLPQLAQNLRDGQTDGMIERFLWSYPEVSYPAWTDDAVPTEVLVKTTDLFRELHEGRSDVPIELSPEALDLWKAWNAENAKRLHGSNGIANAMYSKMQLQLARIALVLHCLTHPANPSQVALSVGTMTDAVELAEYFVGHNLLVFAAIEQGASRSSGRVEDRVLKVLDARDCGPVSRTEFNEAFGGNKSSAEIGAALESLQSLGLVEAERVETGGRPAELWRCTEERRNGRTPIRLTA